jgi:hypothetical protein
MADASMSVVEQMTSEFDTAPAVALACVAAHHGPVLVDLDETLYLRNSTEDFLDAARPRFLAALLLRIMDILAPWRWSGGEATRDIWRIRVVCLLFPWTRRLWTRNVSALARAFGNTALLQVFERHAIAPFIVTSGFRPIVAPLVAALGLPEAPILAARLDRYDDRRRGKLACAIDALGEQTLRQSLLITDSLQDLAVLRVCKRPIRTVWPGAYYRRAFSDVYLPGEYITRVKRPGTHYIRRGILQEDFAFWVLSSIAIAANPWMHVVGLLLLLCSFWVIYEQGYVDNDLAGLRYERDPKLETAFWRASVATTTVAAWGWGFVLGALGVMALRAPDFAAAGWDFAKWAAVLFGTWFWFRTYNRVDKDTRIWLYAGLQVARAAAFTVIVAVVPIGAVALGANALSRWVPYHLYRRTAKRWPQGDEAPLIRLVFFLVLAGLLGVASGPASVLNLTAFLLLGWNIFRARHAIRDVFAHARRLDRSGGRA